MAAMAAPGGPCLQPTHEPATGRLAQWLVLACWHLASRVGGACYEASTKGRGRGGRRSCRLKAIPSREAPWVSRLATGRIVTPRRRRVSRVRRRAPTARLGSDLSPAMGAAARRTPSKPKKIKQNRTRHRELRLFERDESDERYALRLHTDCSTSAVSRAIRSSS